MLSSLLLITLGTPILYTIYSLFCLVQQYTRFRHALPDIPVVIVPVDPFNLPFQALQEPLWSLMTTLKPSLATSPNYASFLPYIRRGWHHAAGYKPFKVLKSPIFAFVTPGGAHLQVADPDGIVQLLTDRPKGLEQRGFVRAAKSYKLLEVFGPVLSTADNLNWVRHRKVVAAPFSESVMNDVWRESLGQVTDLVAAWEKSEAVGVIATDMRTISLNVLSGSGFRKKVLFESAMASEKRTGSMDTIQLGAPMGWRLALQLVLENATTLMVFPSRYMRWPMWGKKLRQIGEAASEFERHAHEMLREEMDRHQHGKAETGGMMSAFVRAIEVNKKSRQAKSREVKVQSSSIQGLSPEEVVGNIFVINFAGHDTTANTLAFALLQLTAEPKVQDWIRAELTQQARGSDPSSWNYADMYPHLTRVQALLQETLRLYPPVMALPRTTTTQPAPLRLSDGRTFTIPAETVINCGVIAVQMSPQIWGPDSEDWRPQRWIVNDQKQTAPKFDAGRETLCQPRRGTYAAWSDGPQNCVGMKFSQVEFVAVIAGLLLKHKLEAVPLASEKNSEQTRQRVLGVLHNTEMEALLKMRDGDKVNVRLIKL
jgi:cytochrome P450